MNQKPQIVTHYTDGTPSETRDMTDEEITELPKAIDDLAD
jgi:hypothetical protein